LLSTTSHKSLKQNNGKLFWISLIVLIDILRWVNITIDWGVWSNLNLRKKVIFFISVILNFLKLDCSLDGHLSLLESLNVSVLFAG
jgi:hypothetical protein